MFRLWGYELSDKWFFSFINGYLVLSSGNPEEEVFIWKSLPAWKPKKELLSCKHIIIWWDGHKPCYIPYIIWSYDKLYIQRWTAHFQKLVFNASLKILKFMHLTLKEISKSNFCFPLPISSFKFNFPYFYINPIQLWYFFSF